MCRCSRCFLSSPVENGTMLLEKLLMFFFTEKAVYFMSVSFKGI